MKKKSLIIIGVIVVLLVVVGYALYSYLWTCCGEDANGFLEKPLADNVERGISECTTDDDCVVALDLRDLCLFRSAYPKSVAKENEYLVEDPRIENFDFLREKYAPPNYKTTFCEPVSPDWEVEKAVCSLGQCEEKHKSGYVGDELIS